MFALLALPALVQNKILLNFDKAKPAQPVFPRNRLDFQKIAAMISPMALPNEPVTLSVEQISELNRQLSTLRHDVNNHLMLIMTAVELFRLKPENGERMLTMMSEQPQKIGTAIKLFSGELEAALRITRP